MEEVRRRRHVHPGKNILQQSAIIIIANDAADGNLATEGNQIIYDIAGTSQTDILAQTYVEPPQLMRLAERLGMGTKPLTAEEFVAYWSLR